MHFSYICSTNPDCREFDVIAADTVLDETTAEAVETPDCPDPLT